MKKKKKEKQQQTERLRTKKYTDLYPIQDFCLDISTYALMKILCDIRFNIIIFISSKCTCKSHIDISLIEST